MKKILSVVMALAMLVIMSGACSSDNKIASQNSSVTNQNGENKVVVLMYHSIVNDISKRSKYVITPNQLTEDVQYLLNNGYKIVSSSELLKIVSAKKGFDKLALLTFDDGFYSNVLYAMPILNKFGVKGVFAMVGSYLDNKNLTNNNGIYRYMDRNDVVALNKTMEIASHSYNMHNLKGRKGISKLSSESISEYTNNITKDFSKNDALLKSLGCNVVTFAYPFGIYNSTSEKVLSDLGYKITLSCNEGINYPSTVKDLMLLKRFNREGDISTTEFMQKHKIN